MHPIARSRTQPERERMVNLEDFTIQSALCLLSVILGWLCWLSTWLTRGAITTVEVNVEF